ncbi:ABC transporter permease [Candidatus Poribacteria bacterium]|nr:ABC transporter permease [Candidatus Poribacteria bacterium]
MQITQAFNIGLSALRRNKLRSLLTMLGIIIGISAVVGMVSVGGGAKFLVLAEFERIGGANTIVCFRPRWIQTKEGKWEPNKSPVYLEYEDVNAILETCPSVKSVSADLDTMERLVSHKGQSRPLRFEGVTPLYQEVHNWYTQSGRFIQKDDLERKETVCVIGSKVQEELFGRTDAVGQEVRIGSHRFTVIGVMQEKGNKMATEGWDERIIIPFTTMETRFIGNQKWGFELYIHAVNFEKVEQALAEVKIALRRRHGSEEHFLFFTAKEFLEQAGNVSKVLQVLLGGVASVALFVGGIGIMNIMLVSVTERTREIGLRKAVGAQRSDILQQFLIEAVVLSLSGGLIGILIGGGIGFGAAWAVTKFLIKEANWPAVVSLQAAFIAFGTSAIIGMFFGIYPANKASRLTPTEALRHE